jgi:hypothetical protein
MRFSAIFQLPAVPMQPAAPAREAAAADLSANETPSRPAAASPELPDDLDARVRMVGEWQLGDAY